MEQRPVIVHFPHQEDARPLIIDKEHVWKKIMYISKLVPKAVSTDSAGPLHCAIDIYHIRKEAFEKVLEIVQHNDYVTYCSGDIRHNTQIPKKMRDVFIYATANATSTSSLPSEEIQEDESMRIQSLCSIINAAEKLEMTVLHKWLVRYLSILIGKKDTKDMQNLMGTRA